MTHSQDNKPAPAHDAVDIKTVPAPRKGQVTENLSREEFRGRLTQRFYDPLFAPEREAIGRLETIAPRKDRFSGEPRGCGTDVM